MRGHNMPDQCQTESRATNLLGHWIACAIELLKNLLLFRWVDPNALISDFDRYRVAGAPYGNSNLLCICRVLHGVIDQIPESL
jgi:hypothetical protein